MLRNRLIVATYALSLGLVPSLGACEDIAVPPDQAADVAGNAAPIFDEAAFEPDGEPRVREGEEITVTVTATDPDGDALTLGVPNQGDLPGAVTFDRDDGGAAATGTLTWTPSHDAVERGEGTGTFTLVFRAEDDGEPSERTDFEVEVVVEDVNRPPEVSFEPERDPYQVSEGEEIRIDVTAMDPDGDVVELEALGLLAIEQLGGEPAWDGEGQASGTFAWTPPHGTAGGPSGSTTVDLVFRARDDRDEPGTTERKATIEIFADNRPPTLQVTDEVTVTEGEELSFVVSAVDPDGHDVAALEASFDGLPGEPDFTVNDIGDDEATGTFTWTPPRDVADVAEPEVSFTVTFRAEDDRTPPAEVQREVTIIVVDDNRPPELEQPVITVQGAPVTDPDEPVLLVEGWPLVIDVEAADPDGDPVALSIDGLDELDGEPAWEITADEEAGVVSGRLTWTPPADALPCCETEVELSLTFRAEEDHGVDGALFDERVVVVRVQNDEDEDGEPDGSDPDIDGDGHLNADDNCPYHANPDQSDLDGDGLGDACDPDGDGDGVCEGAEPCSTLLVPDGGEHCCSGGTDDNCPGAYNPAQADLDGDGVGLACDDLVELEPELYEAAAGVEVLGATRQRSVALAFGELLNCALDPDPEAACEASLLVIGSESALAEDGSMILDWHAIQRTPWLDVTPDGRVELPWIGGDRAVLLPAVGGEDAGPRLDRVVGGEHEGPDALAELGLTLDPNEAPCFAWLGSGATLVQSGSRLYEVIGDGTFEGRISEAEAFRDSRPPETNQPPECSSRFQWQRGGDGTVYVPWERQSDGAFGLRAFLPDGESQEALGSLKREVVFLESDRDAEGLWYCHLSSAGPATVSLVRAGAMDTSRTRALSGATGCGPTDLVAERAPDGSWWFVYATADASRQVAWWNPETDKSLVVLPGNDDDVEIYFAGEGEQAETYLVVDVPGGPDVLWWNPGDPQALTGAAYETARVDWDCSGESVGRTSFTADRGILAVVAQLSTPEGSAAWGCMAWAPPSGGASPKAVELPLPNPASSHQGTWITRGDDRAVAYFHMQPTGGGTSHVAALLAFPELGTLEPTTHELLKTTGAARVTTVSGVTILGVDGPERGLYAVHSSGQGNLQLEELPHEAASRPQTTLLPTPDGLTSDGSLWLLYRRGSSEDERDAIARATPTVGSEVDFEVVASKILLGTTDAWLATGSGEPWVRFDTEEGASLASLAGGEYELVLKGLTDLEPITHRENGATRLWGVAYRTDAEAPWVVRRLGAEACWAQPAEADTLLWGPEVDADGNAAAVFGAGAPSTPAIDEAWLWRNLAPPEDTCP